MVRSLLEKGESMDAESSKYDALTMDQLLGVVGKKWTTFPDCIGAFIAEMDFATAPAVQDALRKTVDAGFFGYLPDGLAKEMAEACNGWYERSTGWSPGADHIFPMPDVLKGLELTLNLFAPKGGAVIVPTPAYMPFLFVPKVFNREIIEVPMKKDGDGNWAYCLDGIEQAFKDGAEVLVLCNPHNPIGRVLRRDEMEAIAGIVDRYDGRVFSDEIHAPLVFPGNTHVPYASIDATTAGHTITAIAASKAWNLAGLKCAQIVLSNDADMQIWNDGGSWAAHGASTIGVIASIAAYNEGGEWLEDVVDYLDGNRRRLGELVAEYLPGVTYIMPEGTYLAWLDFTDTNVDDDIATFFRDHAHVAPVDGCACGEVGKKCVRFNFAMPRPLMEQAIVAMGQALKEAVPA